MSASIFDKRLVVVAGKGGVGRTTVAAALASAAARRGKRVLLAQTRSKERLSALLGAPPVMSELLRVRANLWAVNIFPENALREYGLMVLKTRLLYEAVLENRVSRAFVRAIPGVEDYSMLGKIWFHTTETLPGDPRRPLYDLVIVDGPATGHIITMLQLPEAILASVPEGPLTRDARSARDLLVDATRTAMMIVSLGEEMPVNETIELAKKARERIGIHLGPVVLNQLYPPRFVTGPSSRALELLPETIGDELTDPVLGPLLLRARIAAGRRAMNDRNVQRLTEELGLPLVQLPYLFVPRFDSAATEDLSRRLEAQLAQLS